MKVKYYIAIMLALIGRSAVADEGVAEADAHIKAGTYTNIDSMVVYQNGELVSEYYYGRFKADTLHRTHSSFKSITALLTLIAIDDGLLLTEEPILPLLQRYHPEIPGAEEKQNIRVVDLLNMASGLSCDEAPGSDGPNHEEGVDEGPAPLQYSLDIAMANEPGNAWHYCSANSFLLAATVSAALDRAGGPDIFTYADAELFSPLGIKNYRLTRSLDGKYLNGQGNSYFAPKDLAKIGLLVLNKGRWEDQQLISTASVALLFERTYKINWLWTDEIEGYQPSASYYSYQWYKSDFKVGDKAIEAVHSWGNGGQFIFVVPQLNMVAVFTGSNQGSYRLDKQKQPFDIMYRYILPGYLEETR